MTETTHDTAPCTDAGEHRLAQRHTEAQCPAAVVTLPEEPTRYLTAYRQFLAEEVFDTVEYLAQYERDCAEDRANGHRPHYCVHGTNMWVDYDCACWACEQSLTVWDLAEQRAWQRHARYLVAVDEMRDVTSRHARVNYPDYVVDAFVRWCAEAGPASVSPAKAES